MRGIRNGTVLGVIVAAAACVAAATAGLQAAPAGPTFKEVGRWGKAGTANGQFNNALGITTDKAGNVYVADTDNNRIQVFSPKGAFLRKWGTMGNGNGQFLSAEDVAIDPQGNVWVADYRNDRVQQFDSGGSFKQAIAIDRGPSGVGIDSDGNVFVSYSVGSGTGRVGRYDKSSAFAQAKAWGGVQTVGDVEVSADGSVYVADNRGLRVIRYDLNGRKLGSIGGGPSAPIGIGVDLDCNIWVGNISQRRIEKRSPSGKLLATAASPDLVAVDIAVGRNGDVYASDNGNRSIVRFAEDRSNPGIANVTGKPTVYYDAKSKAFLVRVHYTASGVACPAELVATASLAGKGIVGKAAGVKVKAGKVTIVPVPIAKAALRSVKASTAPARFTIVLKTNGRLTTETRDITVGIPASVKKLAAR